MTTLTKHLKPEIKLNSNQRMQRIQDRRAIIRSIDSINEVRNELIIIALFGGSLVALCISLALNIVKAYG